MADTFLVLSRRNRHVSRTLTGLSSSCRSAVCRLSTACFLLSGRRYLPHPGPASGSGSFTRSLRACYLDTRQFQQLCLRGKELSDDPDLTGLLTDLARKAAEQTGTIRTVLEQIFAIS